MVALILGYPLLQYTMTLLQGPKDPVLPTLIYMPAEILTTFYFMRIQNISYLSFLRDYKLQDSCHKFSKGKPSPHCTTAPPMLLPYSLVLPVLPTYL